MIKIEKTELSGWEAAIRGMRNPKNSWDKTDSKFLNGLYPEIGPNDLKLMMSLAKGGSTHAKYRRMLVVYVDITAPLYWWKEFDTYKVGTVANSCSTMHKIQAKRFELDDFSHEHLYSESMDVLKEVIKALNAYRDLYNDGALNELQKKHIWWQLIQLLPSSYNQKRTVMLNYEVLAGIYPMRKNHKLDEWHRFCEWIENLPLAKELIIGGDEDAISEKQTGKA